MCRENLFILISVFNIFNTRTKDFLNMYLKNGFTTQIYKEHICRKCELFLNVD